MNMMQLACKPFNALRGFSLIELMVAMLVGLLVMAGVIQVAFNSKRSYLDNQETAFIQDNTRYALDIIAKDFRATGYKGCAANDPIIVNVISDDQKNRVQNAFNLNLQSITGFEASVPDNLTTANELQKVIPDAAPRPDSITLRTVSNENEVTLRSQNISSSTLNSWQPMQYTAGTPLMVVDANCQSVSLLMTDQDAAGGTRIQYQNNNCAQGLIANSTFECGAGAVNALKTVSSGSSIFPYIANTYYIGPSIVTGMPALKRRYIRTDGGNLSYSTEEIAQGVENMQIQYGLDPDKDGIVADLFVDASNAIDWNTVIAVRIVLTLRANVPTLPIDNNSPDGFLRKTVASTISLRNWGI